MQGITPFPMDTLECIGTPMQSNIAGHWVWKSEDRDHYNLWICINGQATLTCDNREYAVRPWTTFIFSPEMKIYGSSLKTGQNFQNFAAHWRPPAQVDLPDSELPHGLQLQDSVTAHSLIQSMLQLPLHPDQLSAQQNRWLLLSLLTLIWREKQAPPPSPTVRIIYNQLVRIRSGQGMFATVEELAKEARLSRVHYSRCFKLITGTTPNQFLIQQRVQHACTQLKESDSPLERIADSLGYSDTFFFCRQFRQQMKQSPHQYRLTQRPDLKR